ncbi:MAG TPA: polysaccharide deacetylase family protein [Solirubrobacteraceae bacterium]|nr:polysaccharide deacetylase family protein [Solirubrobacteraceae bacterium]
MDPLLEPARRDRRARQRQRQALRRRVAGALVLAAAAALAFAVWPSGTTRHERTDHRNDQRARSHHRHRRHRARTTARIAKAHPGTAKIVMHGRPRKQVALTFDDGFCAACVARTIAVLRSSGAHATIFPNGTYSTAWKPQAKAIRKLIANGQLTVGNHTFTHHDPRTESASAFESDMRRNEQWIERTFGVTARPFFRPPFGSYNSDTLRVAGRLGYTQVVLWSATVADSSPRSERYILNAIHQQAKPGAIVLMHGNYPNTGRVLPRILGLLKGRHIQTVTLDEMLGRR